MTSKSIALNSFQNNLYQKWLSTHIITTYTIKQNSKEILIVDNNIKRMFANIQEVNMIGCWLTKGNDRDGYFQTTITNNAKQHNVFLHRLMYWAANNQPDMTGLVVMHSCDTPNCINPAHLKLGTVKDNNVDRSNKGRSAKGEKSGRSKLTELQVKEINDLYATGNYSQQDIATTYNVNQTCISAILLCKSWKHLATDIQLHSNHNVSLRNISLTGADNSNSKLTAQQVVAIRRLYNASRITLKDLAIQFNVQPATIHLIVKNKTWKHLL